MKLVPVTSNVNAPSPAVICEGESAVMVGVGLLRANEALPEVPPPVPALVTDTFTAPDDAISEAFTVVVSWVEFTSVAARFTPLKFTDDAELKLVPFTVSVKVAPPTVAELGDNDEIVGVALLIVSTLLLELPPPGA